MDRVKRLTHLAHNQLKVYPPFFYRSIFANTTIKGHTPHHVGEKVGWTRTVWIRRGLALKIGCYPFLTLIPYVSIVD